MAKRARERIERVDRKRIFGRDFFERVEEVRQWNGGIEVRCKSDQCEFDVQLCTAWKPS